MAAIHVFRAFAEFFPSSAPISAPPASSSQTRPQAVQPRTIGQGAPNETFISIEGVPHLFVDEGDCIVQFRPAFEEEPRDTRFGTKILPELEPHWAHLREHRTSLKAAIATAIRSSGTAGSAPPSSSGRGNARVDPVDVVHDVATDPAGEVEATVESNPRRAHAARREDTQAATVGRVLSWGEERFPSRKPQGKPFYTSFAMHIDTLAGERTLQGEGLKDAIAESGCRVGDVVTVTRLEKIKVPAFSESGRPIMKNGQQILWDKWLWSITRR